MISTNKSRPVLSSNRPNRSRSRKLVSQVLLKNEQPNADYCRFDKRKWVIFIAAKLWLSKQLRIAFFREEKSFRFSLSQLFPIWVISQFVYTAFPLIPYTHTPIAYQKEKVCSTQKTIRFESLAPCVYDSIINTIIGMRKALRSLVVVHYPSCVDSPHSWFSLHI